MVNRDETIENAWMRSHGRCECTTRSHDHSGRCQEALVWDRRGWDVLSGGWEAYVENGRNVTGWEAVNHCKIMCWRCYVHTVSEVVTARDRARTGVRVRTRGVILPAASSRQLEMAAGD